MASLLFAFSFTLCYSCGMSVGSHVRQLRDERGWNQGELLERARKHIPEGKRLARETLSRIENGQVGIDTWIIQALADALEVSVDQLVESKAWGTREDPRLSKLMEPIMVGLCELPEGAQTYLVRSFRALLDEFTQLLRDAEGDGDTVWLLGVLQKLTPQQYGEFQRWLAEAEQSEAKIKQAV